jgi:hypothetical protein
MNVADRGFAVSTVSQLVEKIIAATGKPGEDVRARAKRLRQVEMLPSGPRGRGAPHVTSEDAVRLLLSVLAGNAQVRAEQAPPALWRLRYTHTVLEQVLGTAVNEQVTRTTLMAEHPPADFSEKPFGDLLVWTVDRARTEEGRRDLNFEVLVWQDGTSAAFRFPDGRTWWFAGQAEGTLARPVNLAPARTMTSVPAVIFAILADCLNDGSTDAARVERSIVATSSDGGLIAQPSQALRPGHSPPTTQPNSDESVTQSKTRQHPQTRRKLGRT